MPPVRYWLPAYKLSYIAYCIIESVSSVGGREGSRTPGRRREDQSRPVVVDLPGIEPGYPS